MDKPPSPFRVIIIGAGPIGLFLAHALTLANIDYIILERHPSVLSDYGQIIFTWPQSVRLLDQIGLLEKAQRVAIPLRAKKRVYGCTGEVLTTSQFWGDMEGNHGYPFLPILRPDLIRLLYSNLKDKERRVRTSSEVIDICTVPGGVRVHLKDGTVEHGSIVIGADGVHSKARAIMQSLAESKTPTTSNDLGKTYGKGSMVSTFHGIFGQASNKTLCIEDAVFFESRGAGTVIQCTATKESIHFASLTPLATPEDGSVRRIYTAADMDQHAASIARVSICPGVTFGDLWEHADKSRCRKLNQEEGLLSNWYIGRIVLVGDSAHKSTSVNGLGLTCGMHSAAALVNELQALFTSSNPMCAPGDIAIERALARYQGTRYNEVETIWKAGYAMVRETTSVTWSNWFWDRYILPWVDLEVLVWGLVVSLMLIRHGQALAYVPFEGREGFVSWRRRARVAK
ncbi:hypothetical protein BDV06DRAFT_231691 [Aspergillus oleicola]